MKKILFLAFSLIVSAHLWAGYAFDPSTDYYIQGSKAGEQGDYETALYNYNMAIKQDKKNGYAWARAGYTYAVLGDIESALSYLNTSFKYLKVKETPDFYAWARMLRAQIYLNTSDTVSALNDMGLAIKAEPENADWFTNRGDLYYELNDLEKSSKDFRKAMELNPSDYMAFMGYGRNLKIQGKFEDAIPMFTYACNTSTDYSYGYAFRAECYLELGETQKAIDDVVSALDMDMNQKALYLVFALPDTASTLSLINKLGTISNKHEDNNAFNRLMVYLCSSYGDERGTLRYMLREGTDSLSLDKLIDIAYLENSLGFYRQSIELIRANMNKYPADLKLYALLMDNYCELGNYTKSIEMADSALMLFPLDSTSVAPLYYSRAWSNIESRNYEQAIIDLTKAMDVDSDYAYAYCSRANSYIALGQLEEAKADFLKSIELDTIPTENSCAQYGYLFLGDTIRAKEFMLMSLKNDGHPYEAACVYSLLNEKEKAIEYLRMAFEQGFRRFAHLEVDDDMDNIRHTPEFILLVSEYKEKHEQEELQVFSSPKFSFKLGDVL